ncbi:MAG: SDR family NAD(P)-dependent oxidoreductase [Planctomycetota bacterium]
MAYWRGKHALVTGGSAGLGLHLARELVTAGAAVALVGRSQTRLDEAADQLRGIGGQVQAFSADVAQPGQTAWAVEQAVAEFGTLNLAAACAGRSMRGALVDTPRRAFEELLAVNFLAAVDLAHAAGPHLEAAATTTAPPAGGHLVLIGSLASKTGAPHLGAYAASKHPLPALAQQLRLERGGHGLHPLLVCPGPLRRDDAGARYDAQAADLPDAARKPGAGARVKAIDPADLSRQVLAACERRQSELVVPAKARLLFAITQLRPSWGDWLLRKNTGG